VLEVADQGPGVTDEELARLGQRFYRASNAQGPGSGLGLSIVQRVAENCGGTVTYRRGAGDRGLVVSVRFAAGTPG
jgi:two-component system sensor histidine kinase QseC